jgi:hypothetical protein
MENPAYIGSALQAVTADHSLRSRRVTRPHHLQAPLAFDLAADGGDQCDTTRARDLVIEIVVVEG